MHASASSTTVRPTTGNRFRWRPVDIVVASVLGVAIGLVFWGWNTVGFAWWGVMDAVTPGLGGVAVGVWLLGGIVGGLIIRKPGAALFVEVVAAIVSMLLGNIWGVGTVMSGLAQGLGAELVFLLFLYRRFTLPVSILAGIGAALGAWVLELFYGTSPNILKGVEYNMIYLGALLASGIVLAGVLGWLLVRALAATGALNRFAAGREARIEV